jgi:hypothetical protein
MCTSLTAKGATLLAACDRATLPIEQRTLSYLPQNDAVALRRALSICVESFNDRRRDAPAPRTKGKRRSAQRDEAR